MTNQSQAAEPDFVGPNVTALYAFVRRYGLPEPEVMPPHPHAPIWTVFVDYNHDLTARTSHLLPDEAARLCVLRLEHFARDH